ncbi:hypothetical protein V492_08092, partial [Pseudogymnoascus sp. VKM F-4246]
DERPPPPPSPAQRASYLDTPPTSPKRPESSLPALLLEISEPPPRPLPQQRAHRRRKRKKDAKRNAQAPNTLHLVTSQTVRASPDKVIHLPHIGANRRQEGFSAAAVLGESGAVEVGEGLADGDGDDDDGDEEGGVEAGCDEEGEVAVPEEDVGDCAVEDCYAGLRRC